MVNTFVHHVARPGPLTSACALVFLIFALMVLPRTDDTESAGGRLHDIELTRHHKQETVTP